MKRRLYEGCDVTGHKIVVDCEEGVFTFKTLGRATEFLEDIEGSYVISRWCIDCKKWISVMQGNR